MSENPVTPESETHAAAEETVDPQIEAMRQVRSIQLAASALYGQMHLAYTLPAGSQERFDAMASLSAEIESFLGLPSNTPEIALLSVGRIAAEVAETVAGKLGLTSTDFAAELQRHAVNSQL